MKKIGIKKLVSWFLIFIMVILLKPINVNATTSSKLIVKNYKVIKDLFVYKGNFFKIELEIENISNDDANNVQIEIQPCSFSPKDSGNVITVGNIAKGKTLTKTIELKYNGEADADVYFNIISNLGVVEECYITIDNICPEGINSGSLTPEESRKCEPKLKIDSVNSLSIQAGTTATLNFKLKNTGNYTAKDVLVTSVISEPFESESITTTRSVGEIANKRDREFNYTFKVKDSAEAKTYPITLKYSFENAYGDKFDTSETIYIKVKKGSTSNLSIENMVYPTNQLVPGETFTVAFDVANHGDGDAEDVTVTADGGENIISKSQSTQLISKVAHNSSKTVYFKFQPQDKVVAKSYLINIEVKNEKNEVVKAMKQYIGVEVGKKSDVIIGAVQQSAYVIKPEEGFNVSVPITNSGIGMTKNIKVSINGGDGILIKSGSTQVISSLGAGKTQNVTFNLQASKGAETKNYPIGIELKYDGLGENTIKENTSVYVEKDAATNAKGVPRIIISKYSAQPTIVKAGSNFELELSFLDTNFTKEVKNIKVYLTVDEKSSKTGNVFTPVNSSNTFFIDSISPKQIENKKITLYAIPDASAKTYTITANLEYEDANGVEYKAQELIGIPVAQPSKLKIGDIQMPEEVFARQPMTISAEFYNIGKVALSNFMVRAEGNFNIQKSNYFLGNFEIGGSDTYEVEITPNAPGDLKGVVIFAYDEPNGEHVEIRKPITAKALDMPPVPVNPEGDIALAGATKPSKWKKIMSAVAIVVVGVIGMKVYKKRKKKKAEMEEEGLNADE